MTIKHPKGPRDPRDAVSKDRGGRPVGTPGVGPGGKGPGGRKSIAKPVPDPRKRRKP